MLHWEGGDSGERKVQSIKPHTHVRRANEAWEKHILNTVYRDECLVWLHDTVSKKDDSVWKRRANRHLEGQFRVYRSRNEILEEHTKARPLCGALFKGELKFLYRPQNADSRSAIALMSMEFDCRGHWSGGCWFDSFTLQHSDLDPVFESISDLSNNLRETLLLLPETDYTDQGKKALVLHQCYYVISDAWKERVANGTYVHYHVTPDLFEEWFSPSGDEIDHEIVYVSDSEEESTGDE